MDDGRVSVRIVALRRSMSVQRNNRVFSVGLAALAVFSIFPNQIAYQDLGALLARQPSVAQHWRAYLFGAPPSTMQTSLFSMPRPIGTAIPRPPLYVLASVNPNAITGALGREILGNTPAVQFPSVNREHKSDSLARRPRTPMPPEQILADVTAPAGQPAPIGFGKTSGDPMNGEARIFFGAKPLGGGQLASLQPFDDEGGQTVAGKGEVTGPDQRPMSPAERLKLSGRDRAAAEKCLADAVYFEARDEPVSAQIGVAQVVLNRVFMPFYPKTVCGVVYQNANRRLACQFTFACDGKRDVIEEPDAWERAKKIAKDMLDGKLWLPQIAKSTHYHDDWAHPDWVHEMRRYDKEGGLIFYRPRNWGDGSDEPKWSNPRTTAKAEAKL
jgi:spore germination cell wall hydrolase CwlJ-like protein